MSIWDDPELRPAGDYVKFEQVGDAIAGTITAVRPHRFDDGSVVPQLLLLTDDGEEKTVTAGQVRLKAALAEQRPEAGDHVRISLTQVEKRTGGKTLKHFDVEVRRGNGAPTPTNLEQAVRQQTAAPSFAQAPAQAGPAGNNEAAAAALANLSPDQLRALGLLQS